MRAAVITQPFIWTADSRAKYFGGEDWHGSGYGGVVGMTCKYGNWEK